MLRKIMYIVTILLSGRAMTLAFIHRVGGSNPGDPPPAWLMPLMGDAAVGVTALLVAYLIAKKTGLWVWTIIVTWNVIAIWDALSAFVVHKTNPWPEFFMTKLFGSSMFFMAIALHTALIVIACRAEIRQHFHQP